MPDSPPRLQRCACGGAAGGDGECDVCRQNCPSSHPKAAQGASPDTTAPPIVHEVLHSPGQPLDGAARAFFEPRFGQILGHVRIHTDLLAAELARAVNARAYTVQQHVAFDSGQYAPNTTVGKQLLAHELAHVVQQQGETSALAANSQIESSRSLAEGDEPRVFRQGFTPAPAPGVTPPTPPPPPPCPDRTWPPVGWMPAAPAKYSKLPADLVSKLGDSYKAHDTDKASLVNGFAGTDPQCPAYWPRTLWSALDNVGTGLMDVVERVSTRARLYPGLWNKINHIRGAWSTSSLGYKFFTSSENDVRSFLEGDPNFCRDYAISEWWYHENQDCWREVGRVNVEGLHVCLGHGYSPDIHLDPHQIAEGKEEDGSCNIAWGAWLSHAKDVL